jgi:2-hydroxychromene-2-carboxylate isomerase
LSIIEYFYSAHSAFAYLGSARLIEIAGETGRTIVHKPVNLNEVVAASSATGFHERSPAHRTYYFAREIERWAEYRKVPFKLGIPSNHRNDMTLVNSMLVAGAMQGDNVDQLAHACLEAHWSRHADLADEVVLAGIAESAGFDPVALMESARSPDVVAAYAANTAEAIERSVFGSPTYVIDGDMFYGQDRLELVLRAHSQPFANNWPAA